MGWVKATHPMLHEEVEEEFSDQQLEMGNCELCGSYHPPELSFTPGGQVVARLRLATSGRRFPPSFEAMTRSFGYG
jgi:hypothetical protein